MSVGNKMSSRWQPISPYFGCVSASCFAPGGSDMKRDANAPFRFTFLLLLVFTVSPVVFCQEETPQPCPDVTPGALGCEPVEWSRLQEAVPLPDSSPSPDDQQPDQSANSQSQQQQASKQSITGIIVKQGERFVLKAGDDTTYQLDDQSRVTKYQDKRVKVVGSVDPATKTLHIESIELVS